MSVVEKKPEQAPTTVPTRADHRRLAQRAAATTAAIPLIVLAVQGWLLRWTADDAFINFRVVDQIAHGNGPVFNAGERVETYTSTLWAAILWLGSAVVGIRIEWLAAVLGLLLSVAGLAAALVGASLLARDRLGERSRGTLVLPLGAVVFAALPAAWEFATSGLEMGLAFAWLGGSFLYLARVGVGRSQGGVWGAVLMGLGPLVRPDFTLFSIGFVVALVVLAGRPWRWRGAGIVAAAVALPLLYQLFRMGYFASLVPNTAIAKEAGASYWSQGVRYLWNFLGPYWLLLPLAALGALCLRNWRADRAAGERRRALLVAVPVVTGLAHALYVVKIGGDFMHARLLLPGLFAMLMPVSAVAVPRRRLEIALAAGVVVWALVCALALRVSFSPDAVAHGAKIVDERSFYLSAPGVPEHPITLDDYAAHPWARAGQDVRRRAEAGQRVLTFEGPNLDDTKGVPDVPVNAGLPLVAPATNVGLFGFAAGTHAWVVDVLGLADPIASRLKLDARGRVGHEKELPMQWIVARFADPTKLPPKYAQDPGINGARATLGCSVWWWDGSGAHREDPLRAKLTQVTAPLTVGRFFSNLSYTARKGHWRLNRDIGVSYNELCGNF
jgi:arabinofuranosyltransferase